MVVGFVGSRSLSSSFSGLVSSVVSSLPAGSSVAVGCASGADTSVLSAALSSGLSLSVFAVGSFCGSGFTPSFSAFPLVSRAASAGASVHWLAGGSLSLPLRVRLAVRSRSLVSSVVSGSLVAFLSSPGSRGSVQALRFAVSCGVPVFVFTCGFSAPSLPSLGSGTWRPVSFFSHSCWSWSPGQRSLF